MSVSASERQAYSEIDEFLELIDDKHRNEVPHKLREYFKQEKDETYIKGINPQISIKEQNLKEETLSIIALLNLQYWCKNETEKQRLIEKYSENEKKYQEELREKYNPDNLFKKKNTSNEETVVATEETSMTVVQEQKWYQKIFNIIKSIFHRS